MKQLKARTSGWWEFRDAIANREDWTTHGSLRGENVYGPFIWTYPTGELPSVYQDDFTADTVYVIYSYDTPIAWKRLEGYWVIPEVWYSQTTQKHQDKIRTAIHNLPEGE